MYAVQCYSEQILTLKIFECWDYLYKQNAGNMLLNRGKCYGLPAAFFLELLAIVRHSSPVACWTPDLGSMFCSVISFCLFMLFMGFSRQEYWSGLPFPSPVDHILSWITMTHTSWVALHGMAHSFIELRKPLRHDKAVIHEGVTTSIFLLPSTRPHRPSHKLSEVSLTIPGVYSLQVICPQQQPCVCYTSESMELLWGTAPKTLQSSANGELDDSSVCSHHSGTSGTVLWMWSDTLAFDDHSIKLSVGWLKTPWVVPVFSTNC